jgi:uncharacterized protein (TIRG00374 family)
VTRSFPQIVSVAAVAIGTGLFLLTLSYIDLEDTVERAGRLGLALPAILLPGTCWHLLRTWGWSVAFPDDARPAFSRLFRVRLAADAVGFFTVRGLTGEPLKVLLLYDRVTPQVAAAAIALERLAFAVIATIVAGAASLLALTRLELTGPWITVFVGLGSIAAAAVALTATIVRRRTGDYLGRLVMRVSRVTGRHLEASRVVRFVLDVEDVLLELLRGDRRRLVILTVLPVVCYGLMVLEVWLVFYATGEAVGFTQVMTIETFARFASIASAAIPANLGALEASNAGVAAAVGLGGGGALALVRRVRSLLWAGLGLALYPAVPGRRRYSNHSTS